MLFDIKKHLHNYHAKKCLSCYLFFFFLISIMNYVHIMFMALRILGCMSVGENTFFHIIHIEQIQ